MEPSYLIVGNWKMNPPRAAAESLAARVAKGVLKDVWEDEDKNKSKSKSKERVGREVVICPPFPLLGPIGEKVRETGVALGAQDCHPEKAGAHTGDVSALLLRDMGCTHVIVGHSERRANHKENNAKVRAKAQAVLDAGLVAIICVGESASEREAGKEEEVIAAQLRASLPKGATAETVVVAYEPVWAIGTGETATRDDITKMHAHIRENLKSNEGVGNPDAVRILYGGSVNQSNVRMILGIKNADGVLVGGASLKADDFVAIANAVPFVSLAGVS